MIIRNFEVKNTIAKHSDAIGTEQMFSPWSFEPVLSQHPLAPPGGRLESKVEGHSSMFPKLSTTSLLEEKVNCCLEAVA